MLLHGVLGEPNLGRLGTTSPSVLTIEEHRPDVNVLRPCSNVLSNSLAVNHGISCSIDVK